MLASPTRLAAAATVDLTTTSFPVLDVTLFDLQPACHTFETKNLAGTLPDTMMYLFKRTFVAGQYRYVLETWDDDGGSGLASKIEGYCNYDPETVRIIVVAYSAVRGGTCDLWDGDTVVEEDQHFGGSRRSPTSWEAASWWWGADRFLTVGEWGLEQYGHEPAFDTVLYAFGGVGSWLMLDDDAGLAFQAQLDVEYDCASGCNLIVAPHWSDYLHWDGYARIDQHRSADVDNDQDGVPQTVEQTLGMSDSNPDSDGDRLGDYWEAYGIADPNGTAGWDDSLELHRLGASPDGEDIFIEIDRMVAFTIPPDLATWFTSTFTADSSYSGRMIYVHIEEDDILPTHPYLGREQCAAENLANPEDWVSLLDLKNTYLDPIRRVAFHYVAVGGTYYQHNEVVGRGTACALKGYVGTGGGGVTFHRSWSDQGWSRGQLEHEIGHNLGLADTVTESSGYCRDLPESVMNYKYTYSGFVGDDQIQRWSYSNGSGLPHCDPDPLVCKSGCLEDCDCDEWQIVANPHEVCGDGTCVCGPESVYCPTDCSEQTAARCSDGLDNDCDALGDCADPDCAQWCP